jgi:site-specific DNA recombinase
MKKKVIIYTRVSTDEQNNGYSPLDQKEKLFQHCLRVGSEIVGFYHEDESAKTFNRPQWIKIMAFIKKNRGYVDYIYFAKWDRFSRNVAEAYIMIKELKKYGVEPQSIEQPLDFEIPESKIMLAIYLAAPEVDNDRRAMNVFNGMRRARKEGRWQGSCPKGYIHSNDGKKKLIIPEGGKNQALVVKAFNEFSTGMYNIEELRHKLNKEGLKSSRNSFWMLMRNQCYIGKVKVSAFKDEAEYYIDGKHEAIIDEPTFMLCQDIIEGRKKKLPNKYQSVKDEFPLRGYLICPQCNKSLTGSASTGKSGKKFYYYHCDGKKCKERQKVEIVHESLNGYLKQFNAAPQYMNLFSEVLKSELKQNNTDGKKAIEKLNQNAVKLNMRLKNAKDLMLDGEFSASDYKEMRSEIENEIHKLECQRVSINQSIENHDSKIDACLDLLLNLDKYYQSRATDIKQRIICSIFPEKLIFENNTFRTPRINRVVELICNKQAACDGIKKKKVQNFSEPSLQVHL